MLQGKKFITLVISLSLYFNGFAQYEAPLYTRYTTGVARSKMHERVIKNTITNNFSYSISDSTEEYWMDALNAIQVFNFKTPFTQQRIDLAFDSINSRSSSFQRALIEAAYSLYPEKYETSILAFLPKTNDPRIFAIGAEYLLHNKNGNGLKKQLHSILIDKFRDSALLNPTILLLEKRLVSPPQNNFKSADIMQELLSKNFLPGKIVMYSFQRKNRDYPGLVIIRKPNGDIVKDSLQNIFTVPQLARSITNLPFYLRNGNTPQGIFRMFGFGVSQSNFIGPTANVQMGMPVELSKKTFFSDDSIWDSVWTLEDYQNLLPKKLKNYAPLYETYYAGLTGRNEIIAHGTTIDPELYAGQSYFPLTPTMGCLCTKEIWDGIRKESDQQKLVNGLLWAGGAEGYVVVLDIDDKNAPVKLKDILPYLQ
ncbi:MAG: hypothetical protein ABIP35_16820 [Ginsengibacter sp.]